MKISLLMFLMTLVTLSCSSHRKELTLKEGVAGTSVYAGESPLLTYVHKETMPPEGADPLYKRSAYIHPLWSPGGEQLTRIQPPDHYHHYGIWNPWTRTHFGDYKVDFWNLADAQGTVRFVEYLEKREEKERVSFRVKQEHIYFLEDGSEEVAMNEVWEITVKDYHPDHYLVDLTTTLTTPLETGITLEAYRYGGGLGYRATEKWDNSNSTVLTSEGMRRDSADASHARWVIIEGESAAPQGRSGILFLSHPENRAHPEPMRMWPPDSNNGKENVFFEFCPIRHKEWHLEKGIEYTLRYEMVVFDGNMDPEAAEGYWNQFSQLKH